MCIRKLKVDSANRVKIEFIKWTSIIFVSFLFCACAIKGQYYTPPYQGVTPKEKISLSVGIYFNPIVIGADLRNTICYGQDKLFYVPCGKIFVDKSIQAFNTLFRRVELIDLPSSSDRIEQLKSRNLDLLVELSLPRHDQLYTKPIFLFNWHYFHAEYEINVVFYTPDSKRIWESRAKNITPEKLFIYSKGGLLDMCNQVSTAIDGCLSQIISNLAISDLLVSSILRTKEGMTKAPETSIPLSPEKSIIEKEPIKPSSSFAERANTADEQIKDSTSDVFPQKLVDENPNSFVKKPNVGVYVIKNLKDEFEVVSVGKNSPAGKAGVQIGDIIESVDNLRFRDRMSLFEYFYERKKPGESLNAVLRRGGEILQIVVKLESSNFPRDQYALLQEVAKENPVNLAIIIGNISNVFLQGVLLEQWKNGMKSIIITTLENDLLGFFKYEKGTSIVDRHNLDKAVNELALQQTGLIKKESLIKVGEMLGATHLIIVDFSRFGLTTKEANDVQTRRLIEIESGKILASLSLKIPVKLEFELTPIRQDLINYESEIKKISSLEIEAIEAYSNVTEKNFKDDSTLKNTLISKVIPIYSDFADKLRKISPQTVELRNIHQNYIEGATLQLEAFRIIIMGIEKEDRSLIQRASETLEQGKDKIHQWQEGMATISRR